MSFTRKEIAKNITRGKVDVAINFFDYSSESKKIVLNNQNYLVNGKIAIILALLI